MQAIKCMLLQAPYLQHYKGVEELSAPMLPIGLASIAAVLRRGGIEVSIVDLNLEPNIDANRIIHRIKEEKIGIVGISAMTSSISSAQAFARKIKMATGVPIVIGGAHASAAKEKTMEQTPGFDYLVFGEGEYTMLELCQAINSGLGDFSGIKGLAYRRNGKVVFNELRPLVQNLDEIPYPARDLCDFDRYNVPAYLRSKDRSAHLVTSRGCPFKCTFCSAHSVTGYKFRPHSPERVVFEIEKLMKDYGTRFFLMYDDTFTISKERVRAICELILKKGIQIKWFCMARADTVDEGIIALMRRSGLVAINFGVESGDEEILRRIKKGITPDKVRKAFKIVRQYRDLRVFSSFMIGLPGETRQSIKKTIDFAIELDPDMAFFFIFTPYPGTEIYEVSKGIDFDVSDDWEEYRHVFSSSALALKNKEFSEEELKGLLIEANKRFYSRPSYIMRNIKTINSFEELTSRTKGLWQFVKQNFSTARAIHK
ncbi:MAG: cobalamin B12-binding domain-containing protein [Candidatus Omnitrophica bacterium]|nr:cobalamin B12-binding domain-containing protein [Candidatus Omnitrophota bacterium]